MNKQWMDKSRFNTWILEDADSGGPLAQLVPEDNSELYTVMRVWPEIETIATNQPLEAAKQLAFTLEYDARQEPQT